MQLRGFSTANHKVDTLVSYRYAPSLDDIGECLADSMQIGGISYRCTDRIDLIPLTWILSLQVVIP